MCRCICSDHNGVGPLADRTILHALAATCPDFAFTGPRKRGITMLPCRARDPLTGFEPTPTHRVLRSKHGRIRTCPKRKCLPGAPLRKQVQNIAAHGMAGGFIKYPARPAGCFFAPPSASLSKDFSSLLQSGPRLDSRWAKSYTHQTLCRFAIMLRNATKDAARTGRR